MKRYVDVTGQLFDDEVLAFAWYDTVVDQFETHSGYQTWDCWSDFEANYEGDELERYRGLYKGVV